MNIPDGIYFKAAKATRYVTTRKAEVVRLGAQVIAFSKKTNRRRQIFEAPTKKGGSTPCCMFGRGWLYDSVERRFINPEDEQKYRNSFRYAKGFAYLLGIGYSWDRAVELNDKAYLFYASLYREK